MKNAIVALSIIFTHFFTASAQDAKIISDCTVLFAISVEDAKADPQIVKSMAGSTKVLYVKGAKSRTDLITPGFKQTTLFDAKSDSTVILRELGNTKYITYLSDAKRAERNKKYAGIQFSSTGEKRTILGYECIKVVAKLADGSTFNVFYTSSIVPANKEYEFQFKELPGFVLEYEEESESLKAKVKYSATQITLVPVPGARFDLPKSGYRVL